MNNNWRDLITIDAVIRFGKPTIKGTRITVKDILGWFASGMTIEEIKEDFPELNDDQIRAALAFAEHREEITEIITT
jgi:uncharacterized protein (DUF433 family)